MGNPVTQPPFGSAGSTWIPVLTFATPGNLSVAYTTQAGWYTQIGVWPNVGSLIRLEFHIVTSTFTHTTASGALTITGSTFTAPNTTNRRHYGSMTAGGITLAGYGMFAPIMEPNTAVINVSASGSGVTATNVAASNMPTAGTVVLRGHIIIAA